jgi:hypothetical protein
MGNKMTLKIRLLLPLLAGLLALAACSDTRATGASGETSRVSLLLTDAPGDLRAAVVTITDIYLQGAGGDSAGTSGRVYLLQNGSVTTNLLTLANDVLPIVDDRPIPAGRYGQLRFVISGGYIEVGNAGGGSTIYATSPDYAGLPAGAHVDGELKCPSCSQSGFKVLLHGFSQGADSGDDFEIQGDQTLLVDFDVSQSYGRPAGNSGKWILKPTLRATSVQSSASITVTLAPAAGLVLPLVDSTQVTLGAFDATLTSAAGGEPEVMALTDENGDGVYEAKFDYLVPGDYQLGFTGPAGLTFTTDRTLPFPLTVTSGSSTTTAFTLTGAAVQ